MYIRELELPGLELVDPNTDYSGTQTIFVDFDLMARREFSYDNDALNVHIGNLGVFDFDSWAFAGTGDFDSSGTDFILWFVSDSDYTGSWLLNNGQCEQWGSIA